MSFAAKPGPVPWRLFIPGNKLNNLDDQEIPIILQNFIQKGR